MVHVIPVVVTLVSVWGFLFGAVPDETESGGGLQVAAIQFAVTAGAVSGGILLDVTGAFGAVICSGIALLLASVLIMSLLRPKMPGH